LLCLLSPGGELFHHLGQQGCFSESRARFYAAQIVLAMEHLHARSIIYRDLKPENLLLDAEGFIRLTDFGLAKENVDDNSSAHSFCGTPEYLAPEIVSRAGHGRAVDWWSLGALLFEMLTGSPPFYSRTRERLFAKILHAELEIPRELSRHAKSLLAALLERDPTYRLGSSPEDAAEVKAHPFFAGVDWEALLERRVVPEFKPTIKPQGSSSAAAGAGQTQADSTSVAAGQGSASVHIPSPASAAVARPSPVSTASAAAGGSDSDPFSPLSPSPECSVDLFSMPDTSNFDAAFTSLPLLALQSSLPSPGADPALTGADSSGAEAADGGAAGASTAKQPGDDEAEDDAKFVGFSFFAPEGELLPTVGAEVPAASIPVPVQRVANFNSSASGGVARSNARSHTGAVSCSTALKHGSTWREFSAMHFRR